MKVENFNDTLWSCGRCDSWYLCQTTERSDTWRMIHLTALEDIPNELWNCHAWFICGERPNACAKCGGTLQLHHVGRDDSVPAVFMN